MKLMLCFFAASVVFLTAQAALLRLLALYRGKRDKR